VTAESDGKDRFKQDLRYHQIPPREISTGSAGYFPSKDPSFTSAVPVMEVKANGDVVIAVGPADDITLIRASHTGFKLVLRFLARLFAKDSGFQKGSKSSDKSQLLSTPIPGFSPQAVLIVSAILYWRFDKIEHHLAASLDDIIDLCGYWQCTEAVHLRNT
jgi:hypothetical protein